jgi:hypothetical protein
MIGSMVVPSFGTTEPRPSTCSRWASFGLPLPSRPPPDAYLILLTQVASRSPMCGREGIPDRFQSQRRLPGLAPIAAAALHTVFVSTLHPGHGSSQTVSIQVF